MDTLPFAAGSLDAIWSGGAIYNMGFESGVRQWRRFLWAFVGYGYHVARRIEGAPQVDERDVLVTLIEAYENKHYDFGPADTVEAIRLRMEQDGLTPRDLEASVDTRLKPHRYSCRPH